MCIAPPKLVKQRLNVNYDLYNILLPLEPVCGIQEQNEGNSDLLHRPIHIVSLYKFTSLILLGS